MAIKKDTAFTAQGGFEVLVTDAYIKIANVVGDKNSVSASIHWLKNSEVSDPFKVTTCQFKPSMSGMNFIAQAYNHLKTLPEFAGAIDC